jgi:hypothetical protein
MCLFSNLTITFVFDVNSDQTHSPGSDPSTNGFIDTNERSAKKTEIDSIIAGGAELEVCIFLAHEPLVSTSAPYAGSQFAQGYHAK